MAIGFNGHHELQSKFSEVGTLGLAAYSGFVEKAYTTELRWPTCYPVYNRIRRSDPEISIVRGGYTALARRMEIQVVGPDEPTDDDNHLAEFYESELSNMEGGVTRFLETCVGYTPFLGWSWWWIAPGIRRRDWRPPDDDPWRSEADDGLVGVRRLAWRDQSSFQQWDLDDATGRLRGMIQNDFPNPAVTIPLDGSLHITFGDTDNPEGLSPLEAIWRMERIKYGLEVVQGIGFEHAAGYLNVTAEKTLTDSDKANIKAAARAIMTAQEGNYAAWPQGITGELTDVNFQAAAALLEAIRYYGLLKLQIYNMQWVAIASTAGTGAYSAMADASSMFLIYWNAMIEGFIDQYDEQVGKKLWLWNRDRFPGATTRPHYKAKPVSKILDLEELANFIQTISAVMPLGEDDYIEIRKQSGFLPEQLPEIEPDKIAREEPSREDIEEDEDQAEEDIDDAEMSLLQRLAELAFKPGREYSEIRDEYIDNLADAMNGYLESSGAITRWRNQARRAILNSFDLAFFTGYVDAGGAVSEMLEADRDWFLARQQQEIGFVDMLFQNLKGVRAEATETGQPTDVIVLRHAEGYAKTLDGVYAEGKLRGSGNKMLEFGGEDGEESCSTCQTLKGKRHSARYWVERGLVPGQPGNTNFECGGYNCRHVLLDDQGNIFVGV